MHILLGAFEARGEVYRRDLRLDVFADGRHTLLLWQDPLALASTQAEEVSGGLVAPMPGKVLSVAVAVGDAVRKGAALVILEAMKMEHSIDAPRDGIVREIFYSVGDQVQEGATLIELEAPAPDVRAGSPE